MESIIRVFPTFFGMSSLKLSVPDPFFGFEVAHCSIGLFRGVVQVSKIGLQEFRIRPEVRG